MNNYYHNVAESLINLHMKACMYLGSCRFKPDAPYLFTMPSQRKAWGDPQWDWVENAPYMGEYLQCISPHPVLHYQHRSLLDKVR